MTVLVGNGKETVSRFAPDSAMKHSVSLMTAVDEALETAGVRLEDCEFFAAVVGAGSFTGIRIGISAMKGFCLALGRPALPVTSFEVLAYNAMDGGKTGKILCLVDALHDAYYACGYENGERIYPPAYLTEEETLALADEGFTLVASTRLAISEKAEVWLADPAAGLRSAVEALSAKGAFGELTATYVRKSSAELNAEGRK